MSIKILTKRQTYNTNIDGARMNNFISGMRSGIEKGALNEGKFFAASTNVIALDSCVLLISGHEVVIDSPEYITLNNNPLTPTRYSMIAEIKVEYERNVNFRLSVQPSTKELVCNRMFANTSGEGTYQVEIGRFTLQPDGTIVDVVRTIDIITGGTGTSQTSNINIGNVNVNTLEAGMEAEVDIENRYDEETKITYTDFNFNLPQGATGKQGVKGDKGEQGVKGETGLQGPTGPKGDTGATPTITATASVTNTTGTPNVKVSKSGTDATPTFSFEFSNLKGDKGDKGEPGDTGVFDIELSESSENGVQNKVITKALNTKYTKPEGGIPVSDLTNDVQTSLDKADAAFPKTGGAISGDMTVGGTLSSYDILKALTRYGNAFEIKYDGNTGVEIGRKDGTAGRAYIDFHTDGKEDTDFNVRILAQGTNLDIKAAGGLAINGTSLTPTMGDIIATENIIQGLARYIKIGKLVICRFIDFLFKTKENDESLFMGLPIPAPEQVLVFQLVSTSRDCSPAKMRLDPDGTIRNHWSDHTINGQGGQEYYGTFIYISL